MSLRKGWLMLGCLLLVLLATGCRTREGRVAVATHTPRRPLDVLIEEGNPADMAARQYQFRQELRDYMKRDLPRRLARYGMDARMIDQRSAYNAAADGRDLLVIHYDSYNPGSSAARMVVGFGAGAAALDISLSLYNGSNLRLEWKDGRGTSGHWSRIVNRLDEDMSKKLQTFYQQR